MSEIDQNKPKLDVNYSNPERNTAKCYIWNDRVGNALENGVQDSPVCPANFELGRLELGSHLNISEIDQNKPKLDVNYSNLERNTATCYIWNERRESALEDGLQDSPVCLDCFEL